MRTKPHPSSLSPAAFPTDSMPGRVAAPPRIPADRRREAVAAATASSRRASRLRRASPSRRNTAVGAPYAWLCQPLPSPPRAVAGDSTATAVTTAVDGNDSKSPSSSLPRRSLSVGKIEGGGSSSVHLANNNNNDSNDIPIPRDNKNNEQKSNNSGRSASASPRRSSSSRSRLLLPPPGGKQRSPSPSPSPTTRATATTKERSSHRGRSCPPIPRRTAAPGDARGVSRPRFGSEHNRSDSDVSGSSSSSSTAVTAAAAAAALLDCSPTASRLSPRYINGGGRGGGALQRGERGRSGVGARAAESFGVYSRGGGGRSVGGEGRGAAAAQQQRAKDARGRVEELRRLSGNRCVLFLFLFFGIMRVHAMQPRCYTQ